MSSADDELQPERTEGFKVGEKKTIDEYQQLDQNDESLRKWKESLGLGSGTPLSDPNDPRKVIIKSLGLEVEGRPDIIINLDSPNALDTLKSKPFSIKEGARFRMKATFKVQHQILSGLKYVQVVKRGPISNKMQEMIVLITLSILFGHRQRTAGLTITQGSYSPNTSDKPIHEKKFESETAPSGMMGRGHYNAVSKFIDDDNQTHLKFEWSFDIKKDW
ncbi:rho GDP dissociation inhibitor [Elasticomyces elasticus]|nr:rho GDP dissociation inhibitor [Elasticomyces elasticus]